MVDNGIMQNAVLLIGAGLFLIELPLYHFDLMFKDNVVGSLVCSACGFVLICKSAGIGPPFTLRL